MLILNSPTTIAYKPTDFFNTQPVSQLVRQQAVKRQDNDNFDTSIDRGLSKQGFLDQLGNSPLLSIPFNQKSEAEQEAQLPINLLFPSIKSSSAYSKSAPMGAPYDGPISNPPPPGMKN